MNSLPISLPVTLLCLIIVLSSIFIVIIKISYFKSNNEKFNFRNHYFYELNNIKDLNVVKIIKFNFILAFSLLVVGLVIFPITFYTHTSYMIFSLIVSFFFLLSYITFFVLFFIKVNYLREFQIYSTLFLGFTLASNTILCLFLFNSMFEHYLYKILGGVVALFALSNLILMFNPRLKKWDKLEKVNDDSSSITYKRPKVFPLAFAIWFDIFTLILSEAILLIVLILKSSSIN